MARVVLGSVLVLVSIATLLAAFFQPAAGTPSKLPFEAAVFGLPGVSMLLWGLLVVRKNRRLPRPPGRLVWWRTLLLLSDVEATSVDQLSYLRYLVSYTVFDLFSWGLDTQVFDFSWNNNKASTPIEVAIIVSKVAGPCLAYLANGGSRGTMFLRKFVAGSHPVRVRALAILLVAAFLLHAVSGFLQGVFSLEHLELFGGTAAGVFWLSFNVLHYGLLSSYLTRFRKQHRVSKGRPA